MLLLLARHWPDTLDWGVLLLFFGFVIVVPTLGYVLMVIDIRAYLRALKGVLVRVVFHFPDLPAWARYDTPGCLRALGLALPCTETQVKDAYRQLAEQMHPDRGGDRDAFLKLQRQFEESLRFLRAHEPSFRADAERRQASRVADRPATRQ